MSVNAGDSIMVDMTYGTGNSYSIVINDQTTKNSCSKTSTYNMTPYFGAFMAERPAIQNGPTPYADLPQFTQFSMSCEIDGSSVNSPCYTPYGNGWFRKDLMVNGGTQNISLGPVTSNNAFTETWLNSTGT